MITSNSKHEQGLSFAVYKTQGGSEPHVQNFFKKVASHPAYQNSIIRTNFTVPFLKYKRLKLKLRVFLAGHNIASRK